MNSIGLRLERKGFCNFMALFKILKGSSEGLKKLKATEGYAYFTPDDGKFYIDIGTTSTPQQVIVGNNSEEQIVEGQEVNRICINQRVFSDYDILNCGSSSTVIDPNTENYLVFDCN